jgi:chitinase
VQDVSFAWATADGSAVTPGDYFASSSSGQQIRAGQGSTTFGVYVTGDTLDENDETFSVTVSSAQNATIAQATGIATIVDDDAPPVLSIDNGGCNINEGNTGTTPCPFVVRLTPVSGRAVSFSSATADGTATSGLDYTGHGPTPRSIPAGQTSLTINIPVIGDQLREGPESYSLNLSGIQNATPGALSATGSINDDEVNDAQFIAQSVPTNMLVGQSYPVSVRMRNTGNSVWTAGALYRLGSANPRDNGTWGTNRVELPGSVAPGADAIFTFNVTAPAAPGSYNFQWQMVQDAVEWFGPNSTNAVVAVSVLGMSIEDIGVTEVDAGLQTASVMVSLSQASAQVVSVNWISTNGPTHDANPSFETPVVPGGGVATYSAGQSFGGWIVGSGSVDAVGTALWNAAYGTQSLDLNGGAPGSIYQDLSVVPGQSYTVSFMLAGNPGCGGPARKSVELSWGGSVVNVYDFDTTGHSPPDLGFGVHQATLVAAAATQRLEIKSLSAGACGPVLDVVTVKSAGGATASGDYQAASGTLQFAPGETSKTIPVVIVGDYAIEPDEQIWVDLSGPTNISLSDTRGILTVVNNDQPGTLVISPSSNSALESNGALGIVVNRSGGLAQDVGVTLSPAAGTATPGTDYDATAQRVTFAGAESAHAAGITLFDDVLDENDETLNASIGSALGGASIGAPASIAATILDNDPTPALGVDNNGCSVTEGNSASVNCAFVVRLAAVSGRAVSFTTGTGGGTATAGTDYTAHTNIVRTLNAGLPTLTVLVPVLGDTQVEPSETFLLNVTGVTNATPGSFSATGTILNDDTAVNAGSLRVRNATVEVIETRANVTIEIERVGGSEGAASVNFASSNGSALAAFDYVATSGTLNWANAEGGIRTLTVDLINTAALEPDEDFFLGLAGAAGATLGTPTQTRVLIHDGANALMATGFE